MWLFDIPKNYPEMLKKIAWTMFFVVAIFLFIFSNISEAFSTFMSEISFGLRYENYGLKMYISYIYIPLIFALLENIFKLHDLISDVFRIRFRFDKHIIIKEFLVKCNKINKIDSVNMENRDEIMSNIFYKYAGYGDPCIDVHLIYMALGSWSWYWVILDTLAVTLVLGIIFLITNFSWISLMTIFCIVIALNIIMYLIKNFSCKKYAILEVNSILNDKKRRHQINKYLSDMLN